LTNDANAVPQLNDDTLTLRWANEAERETFRELAARHKRKRWLRALARWLWPTPLAS
jgi:hypothetical protein